LWFSSRLNWCFSSDVVPPRLLRARADASLERVIVTFALGTCGGFPFPGLDENSAQDPYNYRLNQGITVLSPPVAPSGTNVMLTTSRQSPETLYTLQVEGIADQSGNAVPPGSEAMFQSWVVSDGNVVPPPVTLSRNGSDLWITWPYGSFLQAAEEI